MPSALALALPPAALTRAEIDLEWNTCAESVLYFINEYCQIYEPGSPGTGGRWIPFRLWPAQVRTVRTMLAHQKTIVLKARQEGLSWIGLALALHQMLFQPVASISVFSRREEEAIYLIGPERLRGMYQRLPPWMQVAEVIGTNSKHWELSNGSVARAFPSDKGDGYVNTLVLADEFDLIENQGHLLNAIEPTMDAGGKLLLISRADKDRPGTPFKRIYSDAVAGQNDYTPIFLSWRDRPDRTEAWYAQQVANSLSSNGSLDSVHEQYPTTPEEALAPRALNKRLPPEWIARCYTKAAPLDVPGAPAIPELRIYAAPISGHTYVIGADPAEGLTAGDDSAASVRDRATGQQVAAFHGKHDPETFAGYLVHLATYYRSQRSTLVGVPAAILPERNNHGHLLIAALLAGGARLLPGQDGRPGWLTTAASKVWMYDQAADALKTGTAPFSDWATWQQLSSIDSHTLSAPEGFHDDLAVADALALTARTLTPPAAARQYNYLTDEEAA